MEYATLGNTGLLVSKLCFGTMTFGDGRGIFKAIGSVGQANADELIKTSIGAGINFFDTADNYTEGESEKILGQSLKNLNIARKDVVIATSAAPTGRHGRSPRPWASQNSGTWPDSTRFRLITRSPAAISNGKSFPCWNPKRLACSCGVRLPAACFPASSAG